MTWCNIFTEKGKGQKCSQTAADPSRKKPNREPDLVLLKANYAAT